MGTVDDGAEHAQYGKAIREFTVSERFIEASRQKLKAMIERRLDKLNSCALLIDATPFQGQQMVAALGISNDGQKTILGLRQGATENATVAGELLRDLMDRGREFTKPRLYVLDVTRRSTRRCGTMREPTRRFSVAKSTSGATSSMISTRKSGVARKLNEAYAMEDHSAAKQGLERLHRELMDINPRAARSLEEGLEETLTVHRLHVPQQLRVTLASTNVIESAFSVVEKVCSNVKRWHDGDQRERWVGSGLLVTERQFRKVKGYKLIPVFIRELESSSPKFAKSSVAKQRKAS